MSTDAPRGGNDTPAPSPTNILYTLRHEGVGWALRRLRYRTPATRTGRALHTGFRFSLGLLLAPSRLGRDTFGDTRLLSDDALYAFYDLQVLPVTFDAAWFVAAADLVRRRLGLAHVHFVVVPGTLGGLREERAAYEAAADGVSRMWKLHNIVVPIFTLLPASAGHTILPSRQGAASMCRAAGRRVYPRFYEPALPVGYHPTELFDASRNGDAPIGVLRAPPQALRYVEQWAAARLRGRALVTITLRDWDFTPARNSNHGAWMAFARSLDPAKYLTVFVPDTDRALDLPSAELTGAEMFNEASWNIGLRMALYERSLLNLGASCGPLFMSMLNTQTRVLIFKIVAPSVPQTSEVFMRQLGYEIGAQLPFATPFQRLVWEPDSAEVIGREFAAMIKRIEGL